MSKLLSLFKKQQFNNTTTQKLLPEGKSCELGLLDFVRCFVLF